MASSTFIAPNIFPLITVRLDGCNYLNWVSQILPVLRSHDLHGFIDGSRKCPAEFLPSTANATPTVNLEFLLWKKQDQFVLGCINASVTEPILSCVYGMTTAQQAWETLSKRFASQSRLRLTLLQNQLQNLQQGSKSCVDFLIEIKATAHQLAAAGKPLSDEDLINYVVRGLNPCFNPFIVSCAFALRAGSMQFDDFKDELISYEILLNNQSRAANVDQHFAMAAQHSRGGFSRPSRGGRGFNRQKAGENSGNSQRGNSQDTKERGPQGVQLNMPTGFRPTGQTGPFPANNFQRPACQICGKTSHTALDCFHRMYYSYQGRHQPNSLAAMVAQRNGQLEEEWLLDSGANEHIANSNNQFNTQTAYHGEESVTVGNGTVEANRTDPPSGPK